MNKKYIIRAIIIVCAIIGLFSIVSWLLRYNLESLDKIYYIASTLGVLITLIALGFAYYIPVKIAKEQSVISKQQNELLEQQTQISKQQANISEQQNKIALFEKRYELYSVYRIFTYNASLVLYMLSNSVYDDSDNKMQVWFDVIHYLLYPSNIEEFIKIWEQENQKAHDNWQNYEKATNAKNMTQKCKNNERTLCSSARLESTRYILQLEKIKYLFKLSMEENTKLNDILNDLDSSYVDANNKNIVCNEFKIKLTELCTNITNSKICETMEKELSLLETINPIAKVTKE